MRGLGSGPSLTKLGAFGADPIGKKWMICNKTEIKANFHFPHYKSMETLSCHNNQNA